MSRLARQCSESTSRRHEWHLGRTTAGSSARAVHAHPRATRDTNPRVRARRAYPSVVTTAFRSTNGDSPGSTVRSAAPTEHFPLTRRDLAFIVGFWLLYALLTIANHAFDPGPPGRRPDGSLTMWIIVAFSEAGL